jgi:outer membrane protein assembly factor BamB
MSVDAVTSLPSVPEPIPGIPSPPVVRPRLWPAVGLVAVYWGTTFVQDGTEWGRSLGFLGFLVRMGVCGGITLLFALWWVFASRSGGWLERLAILAVAVGAGVVTVFLAHPKFMVPVLLLLALPWVMTGWTAALWATRTRSPAVRDEAVLAAVCLAWGAFLLLRMQELRGNGQPDLHWRWSLTAGERYVAEQPADLTGDRTTLALRPGDWPGFRGPRRDADVRGVRITTDWKTAPPDPAWRKPIGEGWSSLAVVGDRLFTQEQAGKVERVICLDTATGRLLWAHEDTSRHTDSQGGDGPRATPTFADGRLYTLGATGILNCLDAASGARKWHRDIGQDAGTKKPLWGFSGSPLVVNGLVVVFAGGKGEKTLLAYRTDSGKPEWSAPAGEHSYGSPQLVTLDGQPQVLYLGDQGLAGYAPDTGAVLWQQRPPAGPPSMPRSIQPHLIGRDLVFDAGASVGTMRIGVGRENGAWTTTERWTSKYLKPAFNDFVIHEGSAYGFDGQSFTCVDLETGERRWKAGNYGAGQVLLLGDQGLLVVITEEGEVVLVPADPGRHAELGRFKAISGKTWNHPVIAHGRLYVRNAEEIACYQLRVE